MPCSGRCFERHCPELCLCLEVSYYSTSYQRDCVFVFLVLCVFRYICCNHSLDPPR